MSLSYPVASDHQLGRLLQIGMVLEEVVEARAYEHHEALDDAVLDEEIDRKSTRLNSSHITRSRMPSSA